MNLPKISVVMPSFNQGQFLQRSIDSVLQQAYPNLEFMIIDGGSTDGSVEIIRQNESDLSYWVSEQDRGQAHAINKGFSRATGDIVSWLNSDDLYCDGALNYVGRWFQENPQFDAVYGGTLMTDETDQVIDAVWPTAPDPAYLYFVGFDISQQSLFWRRRCHDRIGLLDEDLQYSMDYDFLLRLFTTHKIGWTRQFLGIFRRHGAAKSSTMLNVSHRENSVVRARYADRFPMSLPTPLQTLQCRLRRLTRLTSASTSRYLMFKTFKRIGIFLPADFWLRRR